MLEELIDVYDKDRHLTGKKLYTQQVVERKESLEPIMLKKL